MSICKLCRKNRRIENEAYRIKSREAGWRYKGIDLTWDQYVALLEKQNGVCALCKLSEKSDRLLGVDHSHEEGDFGRIRGLLCTSCNTWIMPLDKGKFTLDQVKEYLYG